MCHLGKNSYCLYKEAISLIVVVVVGLILFLCHISCLCVPYQVACKIYISVLYYV